MVSLRAWPLRSYLELAARPEAVRPARQHATTVVRRWRLDALADTVELLVSELVTNAVLASAGRADQRAGTCPRRRSGVWLASDRRQLMIHIWDPDRRLPVSQDAGPDAETGRGAAAGGHAQRPVGLLFAARAQREDRLGALRALTLSESSGPAKATRASESSGGA